MSDLISREKAIEALERAKQNIRHNIERAIGRAICEILDEVENGIKQLPSAEPKKGQWIMSNVGDTFMTDAPKIIYCSSCNVCAPYATNYCPMCGADMRNMTGKTDES